MLIFVTDLRLGAGDELEDFLQWGSDLAGPPSHLRLRARLEMDARLAAFLAAKLAQASGAGMVPTLVLLGDTFNLWQVQRRGEPPRRALGRILDAHAEVRAALAGWLEAGAQLDLVVGPREQALVHPRSWGTLREALPGLNADHGGRPIHGWRSGSHETVGLPASGWDPWFRPRALDRAGAGCAAREVVRRALHMFEAMAPWIDKSSSLSGMVRLAQDALTPSGRAEAFRRLVPGLRGSWWLHRALTPWGRGGLVDWQAMALREAAARERSWRRMRRNLGLEAGSRVVAPGGLFVGTDAPRIGRAGVELLTPGPWSPMVRWDGVGEPRMVQPMEYAQVVPDGAGGWETSVRSWAEESSAG